MNHGVYVSQQATSVSTPVVAESGVPFVVGLAPVQAADKPCLLYTSSTPSTRVNSCGEFTPRPTSQAVREA